VKRADGKRDWPFGGGPEEAARARLRELIAAERKRARTHILFIKRSEPDASRDRVAHLMVERWTKLAQVEGGVTGALGLVGVPINLLLFAYFQIALIVSIAEAYDTPLEGDSGEEVVLEVLGRAHGIADVLRSSPRVLGSIAKAIAVRHGFSMFGRLVPIIASPIAARLNEKEMTRLGGEALRRFGNVVRIE
jgi:uncharacterized protein (DUF697 family)